MIIECIQQLQSLHAKLEDGNYLVCHEIGHWIKFAWDRVFLPTDNGKYFFFIYSILYETWFWSSSENYLTNNIGCKNVVIYL